MYSHHWNSGLWDCCKFGPYHQSFIGAFCCNCVLLAQVMTRMNLNHLGKRDSRSIYQATVKRILIIFAIYYMARAILLRSLIVSLTPIRDEQEDNKNENDDDITTVVLLGVGFVLDFMIAAYSVLLLLRTRRAVRERYAIAGGGTCADDFCEPLCCYCCSLSQMARQSANYEQRDARWCTATGISTEFDEEYGLYASVPAASMERDIV
mmetsp:Transcript_22700/g.30207  ORF Transcript_22700/g.30207 Transcript_22700/m.30207 type:complete len:208 (-) Transcript_22700:73-696(-)